MGMWSLGSGSLCQLKVDLGSFNKSLTLPSLNFFFKVLKTSLKYVFSNSGIICVYFDSSIGTSLVTSFPDSSAIVQYTPLTLLPSIEFLSFGIWFNGIAPKFDTPFGEKKPFFSSNHCQM